MTAILPTAAEVTERYVPLRLSDYSLAELKRLPVDPDGWCAAELGGWVHTAKCREFSDFGHPKLCDLIGELVRRERREESARAQRQIAEAEMRRDGWFDDVPWDGGRDAELAKRQAATRLGGDGR